MIGPVNGSFKSLASAIVFIVGRHLIANTAGLICMSFTYFTAVDRRAHNWLSIIVTSGNAAWRKLMKAEAESSKQ